MTTTLLPDRPRLGERQTSAWIDYGRPEVHGVHRRRYRRARIAVVGENEQLDLLLDELDELARSAPGTKVTHVSPRRREVTEAGRIDGFRIHGFYPTEGGVMLEGDDGRWIGPFDRLIVDDDH